MATQHVDRKEFRRVRAETTPKEKGQGPENYIRVTAQRGQRSYISYAIALLKGEEGKEKQDTIKISGMGAAIFNAVNIAEIVKRRVVGLHQTTEIASETVKDSYEGIESKKTLDVERKVATILITLSTKKLDTKNIGYQAPLPEDQVVEQEERPAREAREPRERGDGEGRRGGRGGRGGRGSSRGSGRGGRGGSRGARGGSRGSGRGRGAGGADRTERPARGGERGGERGPAREQRTERGPARGGAERGSGRGSGRGGSRGSGSPSGSPRGAGAPRGSGRGATRGSGRGGRGRD